MNTVKLYITIHMDEMPYDEQEKIVALAVDAMGEILRAHDGNIVDVEEK